MTPIIVVAIAIFLPVHLSGNDGLLRVAEQPDVIQPFCECFVALRCHRDKRRDRSPKTCKKDAQIECENEFRKGDIARKRNIMRHHIDRFEELVHVAPIMQCASAKKLLRTPAK